MTIRWITFRIADRTVNGETYDDRYQALVEAIESNSTVQWNEPTSFYLVRHGLRPIIEKMKAAINPQLDMFATGVVGGTNVSAYGAFDAASLQEVVGQNVILLR